MRQTIYYFVPGGFVQDRDKGLFPSYLQPVILEELRFISVFRSVGREFHPNVNRGPFTPVQLSYIFSPEYEVNVRNYRST